ncbi:MAG: hypothetical protein AAGA56_03935 [Myxococcota bacterium]
MGLPSNRRDKRPRSLVVSGRPRSSARAKARRFGYRYSPARDEVTPTPPAVEVMARGRAPRERFGYRSTTRDKHGTPTPPPVVGVSRGQTRSRRLGYRSHARDEDGTPTPPPVVAMSRGTPVSSSPNHRWGRPPPASPSSAPSSGWGAIVSLLALASLVSAVAWRTLRDHQAFSIDTSVASAAVVQPAPAAATALPPRSALDLKRGGYESIPGGVLFFPQSFEVGPDGAYDLLIFFHGNPKIVRASVEHRGLNCALAVINLGLRSGPYRDAFRVPGAFARLQTEIRRALHRRGIDKPVLRRLALGSWSAGYGAIEAILDYRPAPPDGHDPLDALLMLDGIHASYIDGEGSDLSRRSVATFIRAAKSGIDRERLVLMTHSQIETPGFASALTTQHFLLEELGLSASSNQPLSALPPHLDLAEAKGAAKESVPLVPISDTQLGLLRVRGFRGHDADHHTAHLTQMSVIALAELKRRWSDAPLGGAPARGVVAGDNDAVSVDVASRGTSKRPAP